MHFVVWIYISSLTEIFFQLFFPLRQEVSVSIPSSQKKETQFPEVSQNILKWKEPVKDIPMEMDVK